MIVIKKILFIVFVISIKFTFSQKDKEIYIDANGKMFAETYICIDLSRKTEGLGPVKS